MNGKSHIATFKASLTQKYQLPHLEQNMYSPCKMKQNQSVQMQYTSKESKEYMYMYSDEGLKILK